VIKKSQEYCLSQETCAGFEIINSQGNNHHFIFIERWISIKEHQNSLSLLMNNDEFVASLAVFTSEPIIEYFYTVYLFTV